MYPNKMTKKWNMMHDIQGNMVELEYSVGAIAYEFQ